MRRLAKANAAHVKVAHIAAFSTTLKTTPHHARLKLRGAQRARNKRYACHITCFFFERGAKVSGQCRPTMLALPQHRKFRRAYDVAPLLYQNRAKNTMNGRGEHKPEHALGRVHLFLVARRLQGEPQMPQQRLGLLTG